MLLKIPGILALLLGIFLATTEVHATEILRWQQDIQTAKNEAATAGKLVIAHFTSDNCPPCRQMQQDVFTRQDVASILNKSFVIVNVNSSKDPALAKAMQIRGTPCDVILAPDGRVLHRREGAIKAERYIDYMNWITARIPLPQPVPTAIPPTPSVNSPSPGQVVQTEQSAPMIPALPSPQIAQNHQVPAAPPEFVASSIGNPPRMPLPEPIAHQQLGSSTVPVAPIASCPSCQNHPALPVVPATTVSLGGEISLPMPMASHETPGLALASEPAPKVASSALRTDLAPMLPSNEGLAAGLALQPDPPIETPPSGSIVATVEVPLGLDGYCPVALVRNEAWVPGNPLFFAMFRGRIYRLESEEALECFHAEPYRYAPVAEGNDIVYMADRNKKVPGRRAFGISYNDRVYLFSGKETFDLFAARPEYYSEIAGKYETALRSHFDKVQR